MLIKFLVFRTAVENQFMTSEPASFESEAKKSATGPVTFNANNNLSPVPSISSKTSAANVTVSKKLLEVRERK